MAVPFDDLPGRFAITFDPLRQHRSINLDPTGQVWGTGLLPEFMDCVVTDELPDRGKIEDPALRERAADLLEQIREQESRAYDLLEPLANS